MSEFKIEKDIPLPSQKWSGKKYYFEKMEVGDSVGVPGIKPRHAMAATALVRRKFGFRFTSRKEGTGSRIWRIE